MTAMLTLFSAPKAFRPPFDVLQHNAIASWRALAPDCQVLLLGDDPGVAEAAREHGVEHIPAIERSPQGTPRLDAIFRTAQARARHPVVCYVNADIMFLDDLPLALQRLALQRFLAVGRRTNLDVTQRIDFGQPNGARDLRAQAEAHGSLFTPYGIDYFVFPRGMIADMPPFVVGRALWDNWLIYHARARHIPVVDLTPAVLAIHQNHDYSHLAGGQKTAWHGAEAQQHWQLAGPDFYPFCIDDATWTLDASGLHRERSPRRLLRRTLTWPALVPGLRRSVRIARRLKRWWRNPR